LSKGATTGRRVSFITSIARFTGLAFLPVQRNIILSTQVLQEYFSAATRKLRISAETAQRKIELLGCLDIISIQHEDILRAIEIHRLYKFSFWDSLIVRMAQKASCSVLYSEELQHGRQMGDVKIVDPFQI
jgi:predicted nucleic acid-binding protein